MAKERSISIDRQIDRFKLEEESAVQADYFGFWARECANAKEDRDEAKAAYEKLAGQTEIDIRTGNYEIPLDKVTDKPLKITETAVKALVLCDPSVVAAKNLYIAKEGIYSRAKADENAMEHRRSSLNNLVDLWGKEYYAAVKDGSGVQHTTSDEKSNSPRGSLNKRSKRKGSEEDK